jgi:hypothetical protein
MYYDKVETMLTQNFIRLGNIAVSIRFCFEHKKITLTGAASTNRWVVRGLIY